MNYLCVDLLNLTVDGWDSCVIEMVNLTYAVTKLTVTYGSYTTFLRILERIAPTLKELTIIRCWIDSTYLSRVYENLDVLVYHNNVISSHDLKYFVNLKVLECKNSTFLDSDIDSTMINLEEFICHGCVNLREKYLLDLIRMTKKLRIFDIDYNNFTGSCLSGFTTEHHLEELRCDNMVAKSEYCKSLKVKFPKLKLITKEEKWV